MLRLNNSMYSQLNKRIYDSFTSQQLKLTQSLNNSIKRNLNNSSKIILNNNLNSDSISIEDGKQLIANRQQLSSLTEIQGKNIEQFTANNNVLNLDKGSFLALVGNFIILWVIKHTPKTIITTAPNLLDIEHVKNFDINTPIDIDKNVPVDVIIAIIRFAIIPIFIFFIP